jgi:hypothetical protein
MQVAASVVLLLLLLFSPTAVAQRMAITDGNIKSAVSDWATSPTTATTVYGDIGGWNVAAVTSMSNLFANNRLAFNQNIGKTMKTWVGPTTFQILETLISMASPSRLSTRRFGVRKPAQV